MKAPLVAAALLVALVPVASADHHICPIDLGNPRVCATLTSWQDGEGSCGAGGTYAQGNWLYAYALAGSDVVIVSVTDGCSDWDFGAYNGHIQTLDVYVGAGDNIGPGFEEVAVTWQHFQYENPESAGDGCDVFVWVNGGFLALGKVASLGECPIGDPPVAPAVP